MNTLRVTCFVVLGLTLVAAAFAPDSDSASQSSRFNSPAPRPPMHDSDRPFSEPAASAMVRADRLTARHPRAEMAIPSGLFDAAGWLTPMASPSPAPKADVAVPANDSAPLQSLSVQIVGRYEKGMRRVLLLTVDSESFVAEIGTMLLDDYRVEAISDVSVTLVHMPSGRRETWSVRPQP